MFRKTHCPQGHPYNKNNTYRLKGFRYCKICNKLDKYLYLQNNREKERQRKRKYWENHKDEINLKRRERRKTRQR